MEAQNLLFGTVTPISATACVVTYETDIDKHSLLEVTESDLPTHLQKDLRKLEKALNYKMVKVCTDELLPYLHVYKSANVLPSYLALV